MFRRRRLLFILFAVTISQLSRCTANDAGGKAPDTLEKRQGLEDIPDQLAMESEHIDQIAVESGHKDQIAMESYPNVVPVPVGMPGAPNQVMLPVPPGFNPSQAPPGNGPVGIRFAPNGLHPHGQFSQIHQTHLPPPPNFQQGQRFPIPQGFHQQGPPTHFHPPPPHIMQQQQQQQQHLQQQQHSSREQQMMHHLQQATPNAAGEVLVQKAQDVSTGQELPQPHHVSGNSGEKNNIQNHQNHHPEGLVPPPPPPHQGRFHNSHERIPPPPKPYHSGEVTKNILRELFERKPNFSKERNNGFFGGPPPPPGLSHPKILARPPPPPPRQPPRPAPGGGLFTSGKEAALSTNDLNAEGGQLLLQQYGPPNGGGGDADWPNGPDHEMPKIVSLEVKCEKSVMRVFIAFDRPFYGVIFSKGHYHANSCLHLPPALGHTSANFDISIDSCGTVGNGVQYGHGSSYYENVIVVQYNPDFQEVQDQARKLRCTWHDQYEKSVTFRPFPVDMLDVVRADFAGDNVGCWFQIQTGKGPWASEVSGLVKIGQTMTMVLAIKDDENKFDMLVRSCIVHDGVRAPIQLVDQWGCVTRPKLMSQFTKIKNFGPSATVLSYAYFSAFKFPDSLQVHFQCTIQICRHECPQQCDKSRLPEESARRRRRATSNNETFTTSFKSENVGLDRVITVVTPDDVQYTALNGSGPGVVESAYNDGDIVCMSTIGFASMLVLLIGLLLVACIVSAVIVLRRPFVQARHNQRRKGF